MSTNNLYLYGVSHQNADFDLLGRASFSVEAQQDFSRLLLREPHIAEVCLLSTCNRSEIYIRTENERLTREQIKTAWRAYSPGLSESDFSVFYFLENGEAAEHLFRVTAGMDSLIPGETEIVGQVKEAFRRAAEMSATGIYLNHLFETALQAEKKVRTQTAISLGAVSVAYAAVELARKIVRRMSDKTALLIGSGETGQRVARHLRQKGVKRILVANRTESHARELAERFDGEALGLTDIDRVLPGVDLVIGATASPDFIIREEQMRPIMKVRDRRPLIMIDIAIPRDFDPALGRFENIFLHDMGSLERIVENNKKRRREEFSRATQILREEREKFLLWCRGLELKPTIISLRRKMENIRHDEMAKYRNRVDEQHWGLVDQITRGMLNKILHLPLSSLRELDGGRDDVHRKISLVREIFDLREEENV